MFVKYTGTRSNLSQCWISSNHNGSAFHCNDEMNFMKTFLLELFFAGSAHDTHTAKKSADLIWRSLPNCEMNPKSLTRHPGYIVRIHVVWTSIIHFESFPFWLMNFARRAHYSIKFSALLCVSENVFNTQIGQSMLCILDSEMKILFLIWISIHDARVHSKYKLYIL